LALLFNTTIFSQLVAGLKLFLHHLFKMSCNSRNSKALRINVLVLNGYSYSDFSENDTICVAHNKK